MSTTVERLPDSEAAHLAAWMGRVQSGFSQAVLLTGALGSGKSTVLAVAAREAEARSFRVGEIHLPGPRILVETAAPDGGERWQVAANGLPAIGELLRTARLAGDRWLLVLDDTHQYEPEEVAGIVRLLGNPRSAASLLLLSGTPLPGADRGRHAQLAARLSNEPIALIHRIQPWTGFDVHNLFLSRQSAVTPSLRFGFDLASIAGGNPAIIRAYTEMVASLPEEEQLAIVSAARGLDDLEPPQLAARMMEAVTAELPSGARRVLQTLAVWNMPFDMETAVMLSGLDRAVVEEALDALEDASLIRTEGGMASGRFALQEPANPRAIAAGTPPRLALNVHRRASELLAADGLSRRYWARRAVHHIRAGNLTPTKAQQVLGAAGLLIERGHWATARDLILAVTLEAIDDKTLPATILVHAAELLADTYTRSGDTGTATALIEATRLPSGGTRPGYLSSLYEIALGRLGAGRDMESELTFRYVVAHPNTPSEQRTQAHSWLIQLDSWHGRPDRGVQHAVHAREAAPDDPGARSEFWVQQGAISRRQGRPTDALVASREALRLASIARDRRAMAKALVAIGECWLDSDSADRALIWMRGGLRRAENASRPIESAWVRTRLISALIESGDWREAEMSTRRGMSHAASMNFTAHGRIAEASLALVRALRGEQWAGYLRTKVSASDLMSPHLLVAVTTALYEQQLLAGLEEHARFTIQLTAEELQRFPGTERALQLDVLPRLAAAQALRGDEPGLEETVAYYRQTAAESEFVLPIARLEGLVAQARLALLQGRPDNAVALLEPARSGYQRMAYHWRWAQTARLLAESYAKSARKARAIEVLRSSLIVLDKLGARHEATLSRADLLALGAPAPRPKRGAALLTKRQMQVAILAARGLSDKEIARETGTSWRTTTTHMHEILRRLGLRSRLELSDWLSRSHAVT